MYLKSERHI